MKVKFKIMEYVSTLAIKHEKIKHKAFLNYYIVKYELDTKGVRGIIKRLMEVAIDRITNK